MGGAGRTARSATLDLARTACRRAPASGGGLSMAADAKFNAEILRYLNRLSDLCWLLARYAEQSSKAS